VVRPPPMKLRPRHFARLAGVGGEPGQSCDLLWVEGAQFWQFGHEGAGDGLADPWNGGQQILLVAPYSGPPDGFVDLEVEALELIAEEADRTGDGDTGQTRRRTLPAQLLGRQHGNNLPASGHECGQFGRLLVGHGPKLGPHCLDKQGDHPGVDRIGLGALPDGLRIAPDLRRVEHHNGQASGRQFRHRQPLIAARRFDADTAKPLELAQPLDQRDDLCLVIANSEEPVAQ